MTAHRSGLIHARILAALIASGCDDDAQLAFHAEAAGDGPATLRHASAAAYQARELASHREAVAQFERALQSSTGADTAQLAGLYDGLAREVALLDRWQDAAAAWEQALALWRRLADRRREGDALRGIGQALCSLSRGAEGNRRRPGCDRPSRAAGPECRAGLGLRQPGRDADGPERAPGGH